jgi:caffeoyl-CoA O-methyltransferase
MKMNLTKLAYLLVAVRDKGIITGNKISKSVDDCQTNREHSHLNFRVIIRITSYDYTRFPSKTKQEFCSMAESPEHKSFAAQDPKLAGYVQNLFTPMDPVLAEVRERAGKAGLPVIHVSSFDGRLLEVLARAIGAKKIVEIGTLAGFSGICLARGLPAGGVLHTFEFDPKHADVAKESFQKAGVSNLVKVHVGKALDNLPAIENQGPFDLVFIDADKENYPNYLAWAHKHLRVGGVVLCDNAFAWGLLGMTPAELAKEAPHRQASADALNKTNTDLAKSAGKWRGTMIPTGEGLAMGVKVG